MSIIVKTTRAVVNLALRLHRKSVLAVVNRKYNQAYAAAEDVVQHQKFVRLAKERELELVDKHKKARKLAETVDALANAELKRLPERLV